MDLSPGQFERAGVQAEVPAETALLAAAAFAEQAASPTAAAQAGLGRGPAPRRAATRLGAFDSRVAGMIAAWRAG